MDRPDDVRLRLGALLRDDPERGVAEVFELVAGEPRVKPTRGLLIDPTDDVRRRWDCRVAAVVALVDSPVAARVCAELTDELRDDPELAADVRAALDCYAGGRTGYADAVTLDHLPDARPYLPADGADLTDGGDPTDGAVLDEPAIAQARLARILHTQPTLEATLDAILRSAVALSPGTIAAGVNLYVHKRFEPQAVLGAAPPVLDDLQKQRGAGPCIEASRQQSTIVVEDTADESRWPEFGERAQQLGIAAVGCVPLWVDEARLGSLSLYSPQRGVFTPDVMDMASVLATHAALAVASVRRSDNLRVAVASRDMIGQAKGILMERFRITADQAFELIQRSSQATQHKVQIVAEILTATGELPVPARRS